MIAPFGWRFYVGPLEICVFARGLEASLMAVGFELSRRHLYVHLIKPSVGVYWSLPGDGPALRRWPPENA